MQPIISNHLDPYFFIFFHKCPCISYIRLIWNFWGQTFMASSPNLYQNMLFYLLRSIILVQSLRTYILMFGVAQMCMTFITYDVMIIWCLDSREVLSISMWEVSLNINSNFLLIFFAEIGYNWAITSLIKARYCCLWTTWLLHTQFFILQCNK